MKFGHLVLASTLAAALALPAAAQTTQTTPAKPSPAITTRPAAPTMTPAPRETPAGRGSSSTSSSTLGDINPAPPEALDALRGIGKAGADAIIKTRRYRGKDDLTNRHILSPNVYNGIKDKIIA